MRKPSGLTRVMFLALLPMLTSMQAVASDLVLLHARVYPSPDAQPMLDATIVLHEGHIVSLTKSAPRIPRGATVLDCTGLTVTAGLWNSHVHILPVEVLHAGQKTRAELDAAMQKMFTRWGFTTVFDIASVLTNTNDLRARIASGRVAGPRILTTGDPFFPPHGVPVYVNRYLADNGIVLPEDATTAAAVQRVRDQVRDGADGVKIFAGSIQANGVLHFPLDRAKAIVAQAHALHRPVFAHPTDLAGVELALSSGVDILAHVTSADEPWTPALVQRMLAAHMALIPTLTLFDVEAKKGGYTGDEARAFAYGAGERLRRYNEAGGEILFGTDVGYIDQYDTAEEYGLMQHAGMTFAEILASLTTNPAHRFGFAAHAGRVEAGMDADLTVFADDPGKEVGALARVRYTIRGGRVVYEGH